MLHNILVAIAEALFWATGGVPIVNTLWLLGWVVSGSLLWWAMFTLPLRYPHWKFWSRVSLPLLFMVASIPVLMLAIGPPIIQTQMLSDCRKVTATITIEGKSETKPVQQCRSKSNYYDTEYGPWKQSNMVDD